MALTRYTIQTLTDPNGILGDNVNGDISAQDLRDSIWSLYQESIDLTDAISLSNVLSTNNVTNGNDLVIDNGDVLNINGVADFTGATLTGLNVGTPSLSDTLSESNVTNGNDLIISTGDILDINGSIDFTGATISGLNTTTETLNETLTSGNNTGGNNLIIDNGDTLNVDGTADFTGATVIGISSADGNGIYSGSGTMSSNTTVNMDSNTLIFSGSNYDTSIENGEVESFGATGNISLSGFKEGIFWKGNGVGEGDVKLRFPTPTSSVSYVINLQESNGTIALLSDIGPTPSLSDTLSVGNNTGGSNLVIDNGSIALLTNTTTLDVNGIADFTGATVSGLNTATPSLSDTLSVGNNTGGNNILVEFGDTLDVNGIADFTGATVSGLNTATPSLSDTLSVGNNTGGSNLVIDSGDRLIVSGQMILSNETYIESIEPNNTISDQKRINYISLTTNAPFNMFEAAGNEYIHIIRGDDGFNAEIGAVLNQDFLINGSLTSSFVLAGGESITLWFHLDSGIWHQVN